MSTKGHASASELREAVESRFGAGSFAPYADLLAAIDQLEEAPRQLALERASTVAELRLGPRATAAALLAPARPGSLALPPDPELLALVEGVERLAKIRWDHIGAEDAENLRRMFVAIAADARVVLIVLAHRVQQMRRAQRGQAAAAELARETLEIYAPLANRLGVWQLKWELEDLSLRELEPQTYEELKRLLAETRTRRDGFVREVMEQLEGLMKTHGIEGKISGRPKHIFSIYKKMQRKNVGFDEIYDVSAVRIIVDEIKDCYAVLGLVHGLWAPIPGEFDDYIARPKENGYQSLHTAVVGPQGKPVEIQIRTREMHHFGEYGVAAHWAYKEGGAGSRAARAVDRKFNLLRQLMDWQKDLEDPTALAETLKTDLFRDQVYVFTPTGEVVALAAGSTPVDFAYRVHTMVGHRCRGAVVNGQIVPLHTALENGDRVEILTKKEPAPSRDWLNPHAGYLQSSTARSKVRAWFRKQGRDDAIVVGRELLERECKRLRVDKPGLTEVLELHPQYKGEEDLLAAIGFGDVGAHTVAGQLLEAERAAQPEEEFELPKGKRSPAPKAAASATGLRVDGVSGVMGSPANCCKPVPGDEVVGYISRGRGVIVHRRDCPNIVHAREPERLTEVDWARDHRRRYPVKLDVVIEERRGALRDVIGVLSDMGLNLHSSRSRQHEDGARATIELAVEIQSTEELQRAIARLQRLSVVVDVHRVAD